MPVFKSTCFEEPPGCPHLGDTWPPSQHSHSSLSCSLTVYLSLVAPCRVPSQGQDVESHYVTLNQVGNDLKSSSRCDLALASVAQWSECQLAHQRVLGSIHSRGHVPDSVRCSKGNQSLCLSHINVSPSNSL